MAADWQTLQGAIAGEVALPGSPTYVRIQPGFNARFHDVHPQAIVLGATPGDVAETISFARRMASVLWPGAVATPSPATRRHVAS